MIASREIDHEFDDLKLVDSSESVRVFINDDLIDLLGECEQPFADKERPSLQAGGCAVVLLEYFLKNAYVTDSNDDLLLYGCSCGEIGCWPVVVRVKRTSDKVIRSNFQQPFRDEASHSFWNYSSFGPFRFITKQYGKF